MIFQFTDLEGCLESVVQLVDCLVSIHKDLGSIPNPQKFSIEDTPVTPACRMWKQKDHKFKLILGCLACSRGALGWMGEKRLPWTFECEDCY